MAYIPVISAISRLRLGIPLVLFIPMLPPLNGGLTHPLSVGPLPGGVPSNRIRYIHNVGPPRLRSSFITPLPMVMILMIYTL